MAAFSVMSSEHIMVRPIALIGVENTLREYNLTLGPIQACEVLALEQYPAGRIRSQHSSLKARIATDESDVEPLGSPIHLRQLPILASVGQ